jgi:acyl carrier protein
MGEIYAALTAIFAEVFGREIVLNPALGARDVAGWDSFKQIDIIMAVEARFGLEFSTAELDGLRNVGDLAAVVAARLGLK